MHLHPSQHRRLHLQFNRHRHHRPQQYNRITKDARNRALQAKSNNNVIDRLAAQQFVALLFQLIFLSGSIRTDARRSRRGKETVWRSAPLEVELVWLRTRKP